MYSSLFLVFNFKARFQRVAPLDKNLFLPPICNPPASVSQGAEITHLHPEHGLLLRDTAVSCLAGITMPFYFSLVCVLLPLSPHPLTRMEVNPWNSCCRMMLPAFITKPGKVSRHVQPVAMGNMYPTVPMQVT